MGARGCPRASMRSPTGDRENTKPASPMYGYTGIIQGTGNIGYKDTVNSIVTISCSSGAKRFHWHYREVALFSGTTIGNPPRHSNVTRTHTRHICFPLKYDCELKNDGNRASPVADTATGMLFGRYTVRLDIHGTCPQLYDL